MLHPYGVGDRVRRDACAARTIAMGDPESLVSRGRADTDLGAIQAACESGVLVVHASPTGLAVGASRVQES